MCYKNYSKLKFSFLLLSSVIILFISSLVFEPLEDFFGLNFAELMLVSKLRKLLSENYPLVSLTLEGFLILFFFNTLLI